MLCKTFSGYLPGVTAAEDNDRGCMELPVATKRLKSLPGAIWRSHCRRRWELVFNLLVQSAAPKCYMILPRTTGDYLRLLPTKKNRWKLLGLLLATADTWACLGLSGPAADDLPKPVSNNTGTARDAFGMPGSMWGGCR